MTIDAETIQTAAEDQSQASADAAAKPEELIVIPVRDMVLLPGTVMPIAIAREVSIAAAQQAAREERQVGVLMQRDPAGRATALDLHRTGAVAKFCVTSARRTEPIISCCRASSAFGCSTS